MNLSPPTSPFFPYTTLFRSSSGVGRAATVILQASTAGRTIGIAGGTGSLSLDSGSIHEICTTSFSMYNSTGVNINIGNWTSNANVAINGVVTLDTAGTITQS